MARKDKRVAGTKNASYLFETCLTMTVWFQIVNTIEGEQHRVERGVRAPGQICSIAHAKFCAWESFLAGIDHSLRGIESDIASVMQKELSCATGTNSKIEQ
jgi:hypothetical protein